MPAARTKKAGNEVPVRQSPRKRKREDDVDNPLIKETSSTRTLSKFDKNSVKSPRPANKHLKQDIVVDEPTRTSIANSNSKSKDTAKKEAIEAATPSKKSGVQRVQKQDKVVNGNVESSESSDEGEDTSVKKTPRKRKTKEEKEAEAMPLAVRTPGLNMFVGAHVSIAKGVENAVSNTIQIGGNAFALFLQSQRKWENPALKSENRDAFRKACVDQKFDPLSHVVPHGSYLVNLAAKDETKAKQSYDFFLGDLKRCEALGIRYYNFHPGATNQEPLPEAISRLAKRLNDALEETTTVVPLLENMAGTESIIGSRFTDLQDVITQIKPEYRSRIGICIDTCHAFAAGYDLRTPEAFNATFQELDNVVGLKYLKAMHLNDSKGTFRSKKDLHQNIGLGFLGLRAFHSIMNEPRLQNIPLILETPCEKKDPDNPKRTLDDKTVWAREIKLLESLIGMDPEGSEFKKLEAELSQKGQEERNKMEKWMAEREQKAKDKEEKVANKKAKAEKGQQSIAGMFGGKKQKGKSDDVTTSDSEPE